MDKRTSVVVAKVEGKHRGPGEVDIIGVILTSQYILSDTTLSPAEHLAQLMQGFKGDTLARASVMPKIFTISDTSYIRLRTKLLKWLDEHPTIIILKVKDYRKLPEKMGPTVKTVRITYAEGPEGDK